MSIQRSAAATKARYAPLMPAITPSRTIPVSPATAAAGTRTLCIDIGGTGVKALLLGHDGAPLTERVRVETPRPATPDAVMKVIWTMIEPLGEFDRISVGFPGVVIDGVTKTAPNLHQRGRTSDSARHSPRARGGRCACSTMPACRATA